MVNHTVPAAVANATKVGHALSLQKLNLAIGLALRDPQGLSNFLADVYNPASPNFHHFLSPEQFADKFGPSKKDYAAVVKYARDHGLTVSAEYPNRVVVSVSGTVLSVEKALNVTLNNYQHPTENRIFYAPDREPSLNLSVPLASIAGLDNFNLPKSHAHLMTNSVSSSGGSTNAGLLTGGNGAVPQTGSGASGAYEARDFRTAYLPGVTNTGTGQSIGLLEFSTTIYASDIASFETATGAPNVPVLTEFIDGASGQGSANANSECSLDVEMAIGMCPGLTSVIIYDGAGSGDDIFSRMVSDNSCKQISTSWTFTTDSTTTTLLMEMAAQGQSYFNASGDADAYVGAPPTPCDSVWVTTVGGTTLSTTGALGAWTGEVVWNDNPSPAGQGTGGGISTTVAIPYWQQSVSMVANGGSTTFRNVPDVAACANNVYVYYGNGSAGAFVGTSCATPVWAGICAIANQLALSQGEPTVGFINPAIYGFGLGSNALAYTTLFHDITSGNNEWSSSPSKYVAAVGYDLCTGWGSPTGSNFLSALALPEALKINPFSADVFAGPVGGPFSASQTYNLTDSGVTSLNWALGSLPSWLDASVTSGTLTPGGGSTPVVLSIDPSATNLAAGSYSTILYFTNTTDGFAQQVTVTLAVEVPPVITTQPTNVAALIGATVSFSVGIAPNALVAYQWLSNGVALSNGGHFSGVNTPTLVITNVGSNYIANYSVSITNVTGSTNSSPAALTIIPSAPVVVSAPTNYTVLPGYNAAFSVSVVGNTNYYYHWLFNGAILANNSAPFGKTTNATLSITNCLPTNGGNYSVQISNSLGVVTSAVATLTVTPVAFGGYGLATVTSFTGGTSVANPYSAPVYVPSAAAYFGTAYQGGADGGGCTYKVTAAGAVTREHSFTGGTDGAFPVGGFLLGKDNSLYAMPVAYGTFSDGAVVRETTTSTAVTALVQFNGNNGTEPVSAPAQASDNLLYGCANAGGIYGYGTVFKMATNSTSLTNLISFNGDNGAYPSPVLIQATDGYLYGTSESGGDTNGDGTIFKIATNGTFVDLAHFTGANGSAPIAGLIQGVDGNFYGTTLKGGATNEGTVFKMTSAGVITDLYSFTNGVDGAEPWAGLIQAPDGNLYGVTQQGGAYGNGTVFQIAPTGTLNVIAQFDGIQGATPEGNLVLGPDGNLYTSTYAGGTAGSGAFVSIILTNKGAMQISGQPASLTVYSGAPAVFAVATTGGLPTSYQWYANGTNLLANGGGISGATSAALTISNATAPAAYSVVVSNSFTTLTSSAALLTILTNGPVIVSQPASQSAVVGEAVTFSVTASGDAPLVYQWQDNGTNIANGGATSGATTPSLTISNLTVANSGVYSVLVSNALGAVTSSNAVLTVVPVNNSNPSVSFSVLHAFTGGSTDGNGPECTLIQGFDGNLYGTTGLGGADYVGTIFRSTLSGTVSTLYSFSGDLTAANGSYPDGGLVQGPNTNFYGLTYGGGANSDGTFYQVTNFSTVTFTHTFAGAADGLNPADTLFHGSDGTYYGTAFEGGVTGYGSIFKSTSAGVVTLLYSFTNGLDGANPVAGLIQANDGNYYGTAVFGGTYGLGTVFQLTTNGVLNTLVSFSGTNGSKPFGGLIQGQDGNLYGTTAQGGSNGGYGTVFQLSLSNGLTTLFSFSGTNGGFPGTALIQDANGFLYGTTEGNGTTAGGGLGGWGTAFMITTNGAMTPLVWFDGYNGAQPEGALLKASDGNLYGTTSLGGNDFFPSSGGGYGNIYKITLPTLVTNAFTASNAVAMFPYSSVLLGTVTPPTGDTYTYTLVSGPSWLTLATNGAIYGTPGTTNIGTNTFVISVTDVSGFSAITNLNLLVIADPAPTFSTNTLVEPWANAGSPYSISIAGSATTPFLSQGDFVSYAEVSGPAWLSVSTNGVISGTPADANGGTNYVVVSATDISGASNTATVIIYVNPHPVFSSAILAYASVIAGSAYSGTLASNVTDPSAALGDSLAYSLLSGPAWLTVAPNGLLSGTPTSGNQGTNVFSVQVVDTNGLAATATVDITVIVPTPPSFVLNPLTAPAGTAGTAYAFSLVSNTVASNPGDSLSFTLLSGPAWLTLATNGLLAGTPYTINGGTNSYVISATDLSTSLSTTGTVYVIVTATPITASIASAGDGTNLLLQWSGGLPPYQVQVTPDGQAPWQNVGSATNATNVLVNPTNSASYFRVQGQ